LPTRLPALPNINQRLEAVIVDRDPLQVRGVVYTARAQSDDVVDVVTGTWAAACPGDGAGMRLLKGLDRGA
jgi:hypothetical protein